MPANLENSAVTTGLEKVCFHSNPKERKCQRMLKIRSDQISRSVVSDFLQPKVLHSICQQIWKTQQWPPDWKRSVFIPIPKKGNAKECSNYRTIALISHASKVRLKILQTRLQQYVNRVNFQMFKLVLEKVEEPEIKLPNLLDHRKSKRVPEKHLLLLY